VIAYDYLNKINTSYLHKIIHFLTRQQEKYVRASSLDMDFEKKESVRMDEYLHMIELKTSVFIGSQFKNGRHFGRAGEGNQQHLYEFGRNLGIAFQVQDDYLDAFGDPAKFGKQVGGDIRANKKTFLMIKALEIANPFQLKEMKTLMENECTRKGRGNA
jgi:geranylgeranyl diphosphate synthase type II